MRWNCTFAAKSVTPASQQQVRQANVAGRPAASRPTAQPTKNQNIGRGVGGAGDMYIAGDDDDRVEELTLQVCTWPVMRPYLFLIFIDVSSIFFKTNIIIF